MRLQNPFAAVNTTGLESQILVVVTRTEQYLTVGQIQSLLPEGGSLMGVRKAVERLASEGTLIVRETGRVAAFALNREHLMMVPILQIANAKQLLLDRITQLIAEWDVQPLTVKLFGSAARGDMRVDSDIDILVVMPHEGDPDGIEAQLSDLSKRVTRWTGNDVRPLVYRDSDIRPASIFESILQEGIDVAGEPRWLRNKLRESRS